MIISTFEWWTCLENKLPYVEGHKIISLEFTVIF